MAFLDNIKISVKIISAVVLLAIVSAGLTIFSGTTMQPSGQRVSRELLEGDAQTRVELARVTRRIADLGYYALAVTTYAPDAPDAKKHASDLEAAYKQGMSNLANAKKFSPHRAAELEKFEKRFTELRIIAAGVANSYMQTETTSATEVKRLNDTLPLVADELRTFNQQLSKEMATAMASLSASADWSLKLIYVSSAVAILLSVLLALWISMAKISAPLDRLTRRMGSLANGDLDVEVPGQNRRDEVGTMARAVQVFKDNAVALKESEAQAETQRRAAEEERVHNEAVRAEAAREVQRVVNGLGSGLERMARGDLTYRITDDFVDEYKKVREDFNAAIDQLQDTIRNIAASSSEVSNAASEISASTSNLSQRTEEQAASIEETSASMEQISVTVKKNAENAQQANEFANETAAVADRGGEVVAQAVSAMARIEESSRKISDIISVIDEIARQTNLLGAQRRGGGGACRRSRPRLRGGRLRGAQPRATLLAGGQGHQGPHHQQLQPGAGRRGPGEQGRHLAQRDRGIDQEGGGDRRRHRGGEQSSSQPGSTRSTPRSPRWTRSRSRTRRWSRRMRRPRRRSSSSPAR